MHVNSLTSDKKHSRGDHDQEKDEINSLWSISDLPGHILRVIVSFLPTKDAIRTSILSREWLHLWKEDISRIELEEGTRDPYKRQRFIDFMRRLLLASDRTKIKRFSLSFQVCRDSSLVTKWLCGFIGPGIQELSLCLKGLDTTVAFPNKLFACALLTRFHLSMRDVLLLPRSPIDFQSLRTLTLEYVVFPHSTHHQLFSACPSLEELTLLDCKWRDLRAVTISSPLLRKITIRDSEEDDSVRRDRCKVRISGTSNLKAFSYEGGCKNDYFLYSSTSVAKASIEMMLPDFIARDSKRKTAAYFVLHLLRELTSVKNLSISYNSLMAISSAALLTWHLPLFSNLAELCLVSLSPQNLCCDALLMVLQNSPRLQVINFQVGGVFVPKDRAHCEMCSRFICFREHLKTIKINSFLGFETELFAIQILLRSALVLDKLYVCCDTVSPYLTSGRLKHVRRYQIESFPRGSMHCEIEFENFD